MTDNNADTNTNRSNARKMDKKFVLNCITRVALLITAVLMYTASLDTDQADAMPALDTYITVEDTTDDASRPDPIAECLLSQGWRGDPTDGEEAIYAPAPIIGACTSVAP